MADQRALFLLLATLLTFALFSMAPSLDLATTALFYQPGQGFLLDQSAWFTLLRKTIWGASIVLVLTALIAWVFGAIIKREVLDIPTRLWGFILLLYITGPGVLVEWGLKGHWGRARPADVTQFGGQAMFTPPYVISDACQRNCSFVGGESAGAMALAISLWLILHCLRPRLSKPGFRIGQGVALALPLTAGLQRLVAGRHFLSDVLLSFLLIALLAAILTRLLRLKMPDAGIRAT